MTGKELVDMMQRRKVFILCVQETSGKARFGTRFKRLYHGVDGIGVGVILRGELARNVLEVKRVSDRVMSLKMEIEGVMFNAVSGYAPQAGCVRIEGDFFFFYEVDEVIQSIPRDERVVIGADINGHVGKGNRGDEELMGRFGVQDRNAESQMVVDFEKGWKWLY